MAMPSELGSNGLSNSDELPSHSRYRHQALRAPVGTKPVENYLRVSFAVLPSRAGV